MSQASASDWRETSVGGRTESVASGTGVVCNWKAQMMCGVANTPVQASAKAVVKSGMNIEIWLTRLVRCVSQRVRMGSTSVTSYCDRVLCTPSSERPSPFFCSAAEGCVMITNGHYKPRHDKHTQRHHTDALAGDGALS